MTSYSSHQFQKEYELKLNKEFEYDGHRAQWTAHDGGPRFWGEEDEAITPKTTKPVEGRISESTAALTSDDRLLAVSTGAVIRIYDVDSLVKTAELSGPEHNIQRLIFTSDRSSPEHDHDARYTLFSASASALGFEGQVYVWKIDAQGGLLKEYVRMPFAIQSFADRAITAIKHDLETHHDLSAGEVDSIHDGFIDVLTTADRHSRSKAIPNFDGQFPDFGTEPVSHGGARILHTIHGGSTQGGMRPSDELPQIVVVDVLTLEEICRLRGHEDAIMWAGWSLDDELIATASWDGTFKIWDAETGACNHTIGDTGGQNWAGAFLPDGKHVLLSGGQTVNFGIYDLQTAREVWRLPPDDGSIKLDSWLRYFKVDFANDLLVLQNGLTLLAGKAPRDVTSSSVSSPSTRLQEIFAFTPMENELKSGFQMVSPTRWADNGTKLLAQSSESTTFVWDMERNLKWRFQRPKGLVLDYHFWNCFFVKRKGADWVISLDGDGVVRFWKL